LLGYSFQYSFRLHVRDMEIVKCIKVIVPGLTSKSAKKHIVAHVIVSRRVRSPENSAYEQHNPGIKRDPALLFTALTFPLTALEQNSGDTTASVDLHTRSADLNPFRACLIHTTPCISGKAPARA